MTKTEVACVFCKITCGESLSFKIYEDDTCVFILDSKFQPTDLWVVAAMSVKVPFLSNAIMKSTRCGLLNMSMNTQYFIINRDSVFEGISDILSSLRSMVLEDLVTRMNGLNVSYRVGGLQIKANNEARSSDGIARVEEEDNDEDDDSDEDDNSDENNDSDEDEDDDSDEDDDVANEHERTLLLVFPTGISFTKEELREFFIREYAAIEWVIFPNTPPNSSPKFARIVFFTPTVLDMVLGNSNLVELEIEGKRLWARRFRWVDMRA